MGQKSPEHFPPPQAHPPVVLMLHGFAGDRDEEDIFPRAAKAFAAAGLASLRIDFRGAGDSGGSFADTTFSRQIEDGLAALQFLQSDKRVDSARIGIVGVSQGGLVAAIVAARSGLPKALALPLPHRHQPSKAGLEKASSPQVSKAAMPVSMPLACICASRSSKKFTASIL